MDNEQKEFRVNTLDFHAEQSKREEELAKLKEDAIMAFNQAPTTAKKEYSTLQFEYSHLINKCFNEIMSQKGKDDVFTITDAGNITTALLATVKMDYGEVPPQFKAASDLSLAIVAPSQIEKAKYIKSAVGIAGGVTGIGMVISALGTVLGWGAGVLGAIKAFFVGVSLSGPIAVATLGLAIAGIATYFALSKPDNATIAQKFREALVKQTEKAVEVIWKKYNH